MRVTGLLSGRACAVALYGVPQNYCNPSQCRASEGEEDGTDATIVGTELEYSKITGFCEILC